MQDYAEIAHAVVLPPPSSDITVDRVAFFNRSSCATPEYPLEKPELFVWNANQPTAQLQNVQLSGGPADGSGHIFCSHHVQLGNGDFVIAGGLNYPEKCAGANPCLVVGQNPNLFLPVGHKYVYRVSTSGMLPALVAGWPQFLDRERYYPNVLEMPDGGFMVSGHTGSPNLGCPPPYSLYPTTWPESVEQTQQQFIAGTPTVPEHFLASMPNSGKHHTQGCSNLITLSLRD